MNRMADIKNYLSQITELRKTNTSNKFKYFGIEDFILQNGEYMGNGSFDEKQFPFTSRTIHECFKNATELAQVYKNLTYCEGFVFRIIPIYHAWCVDENGNVIEPTLTNPEKASYFGVKFSTNYVLETIIKKETYGIIENWEMNFPLLTGKHTEYL